MKFTTFVTLIILAFTTSSFCETENQKKAHELGMKAIEEMDSGNITVAIELLEKSKKLDPENISWPYEVALAHYINKDYKKSARLFNKLTKHPNTNHRVYQMLGNAYDMNGQPKKAIETYENGIKRFPNSGGLFLERGNMELNAKKYENALHYYEKGIKADPGYPSNYYRASKIYLSSSEKVWGMIYGEIFMNLERNSDRTAEMSKLLYDTYKSQITLNSDDSITVDFMKRNQVDITESDKEGKIRLPFEIDCYELVLSVAIPLSIPITGDKKINLEFLDGVREVFLTLYYDKKFNKEYPNALFDYQRKIKDAGHLSSYNHWVLSIGNEDAFYKWREKEDDEFESFIKWFKENPLVLNNENKIYSGQNE